MKRIVTGLANPILNEKLRSLCKYEVLLKDIQYQEGILEFLRENSNIDILILSELLPGELEKTKFIDSICNLASNIKIIMILEKEENNFKNFLLSKGINNIFCDSKVELEDIIQAIDNDYKEKLYENIPPEILNEINYLKGVIENNKKKKVSDYILKAKKIICKKQKSKNQLARIKRKKDNKVFEFSRADNINTRWYRSWKIYFYI